MIPDEQAMAFRNPLENTNMSSGIGQRFMTDQLSWNTQYGLSRKGTGELSPGSRKILGQQMPPGPPKQNILALNIDDDGELDLGQGAMSNSAKVFRPDRDMMSQSPSQLTGFGPSNFYSQGGSSGLGTNANLGGNFAALPQRGAVSGPQFRGSSSTPTSMNLPYNLQQPQQQPSPSRNMISAIGGQRNVMSQSQTSQSMPKLQNSASMSSINNNFVFGQSGNRQSKYSTVYSNPEQKFMNMLFGTEDQPGLDLSEFPTLGNRNLPSTPISSVRNYGQYGVGMVSKPVAETAPEFQIQQEDFPALPGAQNPPSSVSNDTARKTPTSASSSSSTNEQILKDGKFPGDKTNQSKRGIQTHADGMVSNIPSGMVTDQFGVAGLLSFIRAANENDHNLIALAPGIDLTTLGLNLNSPENLYSTFQSPWADSPCRPQDIDYHVPSEYLTNIFLRDKLAPIKLNRYGEDVLFFLFYMNGNDFIQLAAAAELYTRDWRYHKEERVWITRAPGVEPVMKATTYERGTYYFFDVQNWRRVAKEFHLEYDKLEERPTLPNTMQHNASQQ
ncbi:CCR4-NOT transcription complex subunit 2-like isoform X1 [Saccostrea echinata]|uniref:CCR4-NOT transcription complex subunit 2-like isoform X1 n=1 Tax=Saccostrea echinata TaxID=191078 RepID=UPI002A8253FC|nr:CCR4-NOT transcription complex subunit 2-like isoform X1 [Saccostrea echinata]